MSEYAVVKSPEVLAVEINAIKQQAQTMMLQASAEIGKRLIEAKEQVGHGEWGKWLQENVEYSQSTANRLMQIYNEYGTNSAALHNLSYSKAIALLGMEAEEREAFMEDNDVENMSSRELQKLVKQKQKLEKQLEKQSKESEKIIEKEVRAKQLLEKSLAEIEAELSEVRSSAVKDMSEAASNIKNLGQALETARARAEQLEANLKAKPLEATTATVTEEVVPDEVKEELEQLRQKEAAYAQEIQMLKDQLAHQAEKSPEDIFKGHFKNVLDEFKATIEAFNNVTDADAREKFSKSLTSLVDKMKASVDGVNA